MRYAIDKNGDRWSLKDDGRLYLDGCFPILLPRSIEYTEKNAGPLAWHDDDAPSQDNYAGGTQADWDAVSNPQHYHKGGLECITVCDAMVEGLRPVEAFRLANIVKYLWRYKQKNGKQDLEKARKYLDMLIEVQS